jgi:RNase P subunit RPR2
MVHYDVEDGSCIDAVSFTCGSCGTFNYFAKPEDTRDIEEELRANAQQVAAMLVHAVEADNAAKVVIAPANVMISTVDIASKLTIEHRNDATDCKAHKVQAVDTWNNREIGFKCVSCNMFFRPPLHMRTDSNKAQSHALCLSALQCGMGYTQVAEFFSAIDHPCLHEETWRKYMWDVVR